MKGRTAPYETRVVDVDAWAAGQGSQDLALLDFDETARRFFLDTGTRQALSELDGAENAPALADFFAEVNAAYFAGRMDAVDWDDGLFDEWQERDIFLSGYLASIAEDGFQNHTETAFTFGGTDT